MTMVVHAARMINCVLCAKRFKQACPSHSRRFRLSSTAQARARDSSHALNSGRPRFA